MGLLFLKECLICQECAVETFVCLECRKFIEVDAGRGRVVVEGEGWLLISKISIQPLIFEKLLVSLLWICLEASRFQTVTTLVVSRKDPLYQATKVVAQQKGLLFRTLEEGALRFFITKKRRRYEEVWAVVELEKKAKPLFIYGIPQSFRFLSLFVHE